MAADILASPECITASVRADAPFAELLALLAGDRKNTAVTVVSPSTGTLLGLVSQSDAIKALLKLVDERRAPSSTPVQELTTFPSSGIVSIRASEAVSPQALAQVMAERNIKHVPIVDDAGAPLGVIGAVTAARTLLQRIEEDKAALAAASRGISGDLLARQEMGLEAPLLRVPHDMPVTDIARLMLSYRATFAIVVDASKQYTGILALVDLLRAFAKLPPDAPPVFGPPSTGPLPSPLARDIMIPKARVLSLDPASPDLHIPAAMRLMTSHGIRHVPIIKKTAPVAAPVSLFGMLAATAASIFSAPGGGSGGGSGSANGATAASAGVIERPVDVLDILRCAREASRVLPLDPKAKEIISRMDASSGASAAGGRASKEASGGGRASRASSLVDELGGVAGGAGSVAGGGRRASTAGGGGDAEQSGAKPTLYTVASCPSEAYSTLLIAKRALKKLEDIRAQMVRAQVSGAAMSREDEEALETQVRAAMSGAASKLGLCIRKLEACTAEGGLPGADAARLAVALHREAVRVNLATAQFLLRVGAPDDELMDALAAAMGAIRDHKDRIAAALAAGHGSADAGGIPAPGSGIEPEATIAVTAAGGDGNEDGLAFAAGKLPPFPDTEVLRLRLVAAHAGDLDSAAYPFASSAAVLADQVRDVDLAPLVAAAADPRHRFSGEAFRGVEVVVKALTACGKLQGSAIDGVLSSCRSGGGASTSLAGLLASPSAADALTCSLLALGDAKASTASSDVISDAIATIGTHFAACSRAQPALLRLGHALEAGGAGDAPIIKTMQGVPPALPSLAAVFTAALLQRRLSAACGAAAAAAAGTLQSPPRDASEAVASMAGTASAAATQALALAPRAQALVWSQAATDERLTLRHLQVGTAGAAAASGVPAVAAAGASAALAAWAAAVTAATAAAAAHAQPPAASALLAQADAACAALSVAASAVADTGRGAFTRAMPYLHMEAAPGGGRGRKGGAAGLLAAAKVALGDASAAPAAAGPAAAEQPSLSLDDLSAMLASLQGGEAQ